MAKKTEEPKVNKEEKGIISESDYDQFKAIENDIAVTQRKIGDLAIQSAQHIKQAEQLIEKYRDFQIFLFKKHDLNLSKSYSIEAETRKFILQDK